VKKIEPRESSFIANADNKKRGERSASIAAEAMTSKTRFATSCSTTW
jgi:hypothetical protein